MSRNLAHNLLKVIKAWIDGGKKVVDGVDVSPTWDYLLQVLQNPIIDKRDIANEIRRKITPVSCSSSELVGSSWMLLLIVCSVLNGWIVLRGVPSYIGEGYDAFG